MRRVLSATWYARFWSGTKRMSGDAQLVGDARGVRARAAAVRERFDVGVRVDVRHRREAAARGAQEVLALGDVVGVDLGERAQRAQARQVHGPLGRERVAALGHEAHAAEDDEARVEIARAHGQLEAVAHGVGDRLHLGHLVVVRGDEGVLLALEAADLVPEKLGARGVVGRDVAAAHEAVDASTRDMPIVYRARGRRRSLVTAFVDVAP